MDDHLETSRYAIKTLEKALRIYTPSLSEKALADFLADRCDDLGFRDIHQDEVGNIDCEDCKTGWMIRKSSVNGPFYGCSNFPLCRYTREICNECGKGIYIDEEGGAHCSNQDCLYEPVTCNYCYGILEERNILYSIRKKSILDGKKY